LDLPDTVITKGKAGKLEIRAVDSRGSYVMCKYLDPKSMKPADKKRKLMLKDQSGKVSEYFIIPLKNAQRSLLLTTESEEKERQVWNEALGRAEEVWES
jgi:hypothetical protein